MKITIDGVTITAKENQNIVEIAEENGIGIVAPCFRNGRVNGCCKACIIEINGERKYACCTKPVDGMIIKYKRPDLDIARKEAIKQYVDDINNQRKSSCCSSSEETSNESCCSSSDESDTDCCCDSDGCC